MENKLNKWFDAARHNPPMISPQEVGAMISNPPAVKGRLSTLKKTVFMGTILLIITSWLYWLNVSTPLETNRLKETTGQAEILVRDTLKTTAKSDQLIQQLFSKEETKQEQVQYGSESADYNDVELEYPLNHTGGVVEEQNEELQFQHPILFLDSKELEALDIKIEKGSYNYYYKTYSYQNTIRATQLKSVNDSFFFAKGFPGKNYFIKPWETDFYPLYLTDSLGNDQRNFHFQDKRDSQSWAEFNDSLTHHFRVTYQHLIPIAIRTPDLGRLEILWYKPTKALIKKLPARYAVLFTEGGYSSNRNWGNGKSKKSDEKMINLTNEELAGLGIFTNGNELKYLTQTDTTVYHFDSKPKATVFVFSIEVTKSGSIWTNTTHEQDEELKKLSSSAVPPLISIKRLTVNIEESFLIAEQNAVPAGYRTEFINNIKKGLVPVRVYTKGNTELNLLDNEIVFWYKNNETFWQKLPEWARVKVQRDYPLFNEEKYRKLIVDLKQKAKQDDEVSNITSKEIEISEAKTIDLTPRELRKLHIRFDRKKISYQLMSQRIDSSYVIIDLTVTPDVYYLNTTDEIGKPIQYKQSQNYAWYVTDTLLGIAQNFIDPLGTAEENEQRGKNMKRLFKERLPEMIPVRIRFDAKAVSKAKNDHPQTVLLFWFPETDEFIKALPQRIQNKLGVNMANLNRPQIAPVKYIELTDEQLVKLGIKRNLESITVPMHTGNGKYMFSDYSSKGSVHHFNTDNKTTDTFKSNTAVVKMDFKLSSSNGGKLTQPDLIKLVYPSPMLITEGNGLHWLTWQLDDEMSKEDQDYMIKNRLSPLEYKPAVEARKRGEAKLVAELNTYIALKVKSKEVPSAESNTLRNPDLIIWYKPDSLFFAALPNELSEQIKHELDQLTLKQPGYACQFFEVCQSIQGTIQQYEVYPNPTNDLLQIKMQLGETRLVSVYLTDISGKKVKDCFSDETFEKGLQTQQIQLGGLSEGMYLLHITTDKGEYIVQRVIKKG